MTYTLEQLDRLILDHQIPVSVATATPGIASRYKVMKELSQHRDEVFQWASSHCDLQRHIHFVRVFKLEREFADVLAEVAFDYGTLGMEVDTKFDDLEAAWPEASDLLHRHVRDETLLGDAVQPSPSGEFEAQGMIQDPSQQSDPLLSAGRGIKKNLKHAKGILDQIQVERYQANNLDVYAVDAEYVELMNEYEARGLVQNPPEDGRPILDDRLIRELARVGIELDPIPTSGSAGV